MKCLACGGVNVDVPRNSRAMEPAASMLGSSRARVRVTALARCSNCGLAWQHPLPARDLLEDAYTRLVDPRYLEEAPHRLRSAQSMLRLVGRYAHRKQGPLLDVGCSSGIFLGVARQAGWQVHGIEPSVAMSAIARRKFGDRVQTASFERANVVPGAFGVVTLWDVLEHVPDPYRVVVKASQALSPAGTIFINVPVRDSLVARLLGARWPLLLPEHLWYYTRPSLRFLLDRVGLKVLSFHLHVVWFSVRYVLDRASEHDLLWTRLVAARSSGSPISKLGVPLIMGETTVVARPKLRGRQAQS